MKRSLMITITAMIMLSFFATAFAEVLVSVDCPESIYRYELFTCRVTLYNDSTADTAIDYLVHFDKERATPLSRSEEGDLYIPALTKKILEFNCWANETGKDAFVFEYGYGKIDSVAAKAFLVTSTPLYLDLDSVTVTAGRRNTIKAEVRGTGYFVSLLLRYPPSILGPGRIDVGDVDGAKPITIDMSPDPYAIGAQTVEVYVNFMDDKGYHTLLQRINVNVSPSYQVIGIVIALAVALVVVAFIVRRRSKSSES